MCMEDVRIGRQSNSRITSVLVGTTARQIVQRSDKRIALVISAPSAGNLTISTDPGVTDGLGITLYAADPPLVLSLMQHGALTMMDLYAVMSAGDVPIGIGETFLNAV